MLLILGGDFFLKLRKLLGEQLIFHLKFGDLILSFKQILREKLSVGTHCLIQVLLLLETAFSLDVLSLEAGDQVILQLNLF